MKPAWMNQAQWEKLKDMKSEVRKEEIKRAWHERQKYLVEIGVQDIL